MSRSRHTKTDSESSLTPSSPPRSPRRPVYYVQSPSHDGEKTANSFHSTPALSPVGSPGRHSRDSSSTRFSGSLKPGGGGSRKQPDGPGRNGKGLAEKEWMDEFGAIEEEGLLDDDGSRGGIPRRCYVLAFVLAFFALFAFFSLVLWGASRNQKPVVTMKVSLLSLCLSQFQSFCILEMDPLQSGRDFICWHQRFGFVHKILWV